MFQVLLDPKVLAAYLLPFILVCLGGVLAVKKIRLDKREAWPAILVGLLGVAFAEYQALLGYQAEIAAHRWTAATLSLFFGLLGATAAGALGGALGWGSARILLWLSNAELRARVQTSGLLQGIVTVLVVMGAAGAVWHSSRQAEITQARVEQARRTDLTTERIREIYEEASQDRSRESELIALASNPGTPPDLLRVFASGSENLRYGAAANPQLPLELLDSLTRPSQPELVRYAAAFSPRLTLEQVTRLLNDTSPEVRMHALQRPDAPRELVEKLSTDPVERVARTARLVLSK